MNTYWRLLGFAKPIEKYAIPYFFYTLFYSLFNTFNFVMIIPILNSLFDPSKQIAHVTEWPHFALNMEYFDQLLNFVLYKIYGDNYSVMNVMLFLSIFIVTSALLSNLFRYLGQVDYRKYENPYPPPSEKCRIRQRHGTPRRILQQRA